TLPSHLKYWKGRERSRPSATRSWALASSLAIGPSIVLVTSPGARCISRKMKTETPNRIGRIAAIRVAMCRPTSHAPPCRAGGGGPLEAAAPALLHQPSIQTVEKSNQSLGGLTKPLTPGAVII